MAYPFFKSSGYKKVLIVRSDEHLRLCANEMPLPYRWKGRHISVRLSSSRLALPDLAPFCLSFEFQVLSFELRCANSELRAQSSELTQWLPRLHRAGPSASLDKSILRYSVVGAILHYLFAIVNFSGDSRRADATFVELRRTLHRFLGGGEAAPEPPLDLTLH